MKKSKFIAYTTLFLIFANPVLAQNITCNTPISKNDSAKSILRKLTLPDIPTNRIHSHSPMNRRPKNWLNYNNGLVHCLLSKGKETLHLKVSCFYTSLIISITLTLIVLLLNLNPTKKVKSRLRVYI